MLRTQGSVICNFTASFLAVPFETSKNKRAEIMQLKI